MFSGCYCVPWVSDDGALCGNQVVPELGMKGIVGYR